MFSVFRFAYGFFLLFCFGVYKTVLKNNSQTNFICLWPCVVILGKERKIETMTILFLVL